MHGSPAINHDGFKKQSRVCLSTGTIEEGLCSSQQHWWVLQSSAALTAAKLNICLSLGTFHMTSLHQTVEQRNIVLL